MKRAIVSKVLQFAVIAILLGSIVVYFHDHAAEARKIFDLSPNKIALLALLLLMNNVLYAYSMFVILEKRLHGHLRVFEWVRVVMVSRVVNFYVTQGANVYRSLYLKRNFGFSHANYIGLVTFHTWYFTLTTLSFCWISYVAFNWTAAWERIELLLLAAIAILAFSRLPVAIGWLSITDRWPEGRVSWIRERLVALFDEFRANSTNRGLLFRIALLSLITFTITMVTLAVAFSSLQHNVTTADLSLYTSVWTVSKYVNIVPGNLGVTEYLFGLLSNALGGTLGEGILASGILRVIDYLLVMVLGGLLAVGMVRDRREFMLADSDASETANKS